MGLKFSEAWARRLNNDVGDHVATRQTHRRFWQRVCGSIERRLSLVSFFGENLAAAAFGTFATLSALFGLGAMSDLSPFRAPKQTCTRRCLQADFLGAGRRLVAGGGQPCDLRADVPRMLRSALGSALRAARAQAPRCAADPGSRQYSATVWVPAL